MKKIILSLLITLITSTIHAKEGEEPADSLRVVDIEEVVVIGSPKEATKLRQLPTSVSLLSQHDMEANRIEGLKNISGIVPNFFIPDYGSRLTSAIYIRGIGSRINTSAVGLYVDNIPYIDKSAFDFNFYDIERIDILRSPQSTLYGRNTMGGLIKVHTRSPFSYQETDIKLSAGSYGNYQASLTKYHRINEQLAFSAGGYYQHSNGYFTNHYTDKKVDPLDAGGGRIRAIWLPKSNLKLDFNISYDYSDQGGYAYGEYNQETGEIAPVNYDDKSGYYRGLFNTNLNIEYQGKGFIMNAVTGYQHLKDRMFMDQDFSEYDVFTLQQGQKQHTISEEITFKSANSCNWQWVSGIFGFYQTLNTAAPITFKETGVRRMEDMINKAMPDLSASGASMALSLTSPKLFIPGDFKTPVSGAAVYHQSTYNNFLIKGLSLTAGLRLDYEATKFEYNSRTSLTYDFLLQRGAMLIPLNDLNNAPSFQGKTTKEYLHLLPKFAVQYDLIPNNNIYISATRGFRSGGFNVQMFSDIIRSTLQNDMMITLKEEAYNSLSGMGMPGTAIDNMLKDIPVKEGEPNIKDITLYKPEYSWNYEIGTHLTVWNGKLTADISAFYMDTRDQQVAVFAESDFGRRTVNAGKSRSIGAEIALRTQLTDNFSLNVAYGYTNARFKEYMTSEQNGLQSDTIDYSGNYIPFVPQNTFNIGEEYIYRFKPASILKSLFLNVNYNGVGKIYWTEKNNIKQDFYGTLNARATASFHKIDISFWAQNILNKHYSTFYFETMGDAFDTKAYYMQKGKPVHLGVDVRMRF
ncbi:MAG: TonB-dependent receptor [Bacteroides sp.]|nr:TonB-dependent receptor [Bacteroides sp.]